MSDDNPFAVGGYANEPGAGSDPNQHPQMATLIQLLVETRPWVRLFGVLTLIAAVMMIIGGVLVMAGGAMGAGALGPLGALYIVMALLYLYPGLTLNRYASAITQAQTTGRMNEVVEAITQQKKFWRFIGIIATIILIIYFVIFILGVLGAAMLAR